jgi:hypothetical protein
MTILTYFISVVNNRISDGQKLNEQISTFKDYNLNPWKRIFPWGSDKINDCTNKDQIINVEFWKDSHTRWILTFWPKGCLICIHDSECIFKILRGCLKYTSYDLKDKQTNSVILRIGDVTSQQTTENSYTISNLHSDVSVSLHIYPVCHQRPILKENVHLKSKL